MSRHGRAAVGIAAALAVGVFLGVVLRRPASTPRSGDAAAPVSATPAGRGGPPTLVLDADAEARAGLTLGGVEAARGEGVLEAYGRILDPVPLAESFFAQTTARAALEVAQREYARVQALHRDDANASTRELETAGTVLRRARADLEVAQVRLTSTWGAELAERADLDDLVHGLAQRRLALARLDLPAGEQVTGAPASIEVEPAAGDGAARPAQGLGPAPTTDPGAQGRGFFALLEAGPPPGTAIVGRLAFLERRLAGVRIPRSAVVWHDSHSFVYVALGGGRFERRAVALHGDGEREWLATGPLAPGDRIVVSGAALLLSAEQDSVARAGGEPAG